MLRFEFQGDGSNKFWEVAVEKTALTVRFGKIGTAGQTQTKSFASETAAKSECDKLIRQKVSKGYVAIAAKKVDSPKTENDEAPAEPAVAKTKAAPKAKKAKPVDEPGWIDAGDGYALALREGKIVCRNAKGAVLSSVPKDVKGSDVALQLADVRAWLESHERTCVETVETWMMRGLPTPRSVIVSVWIDPSWRKALENAVVAATNDAGAVEVAGFFRGVDANRRVGVVTLDGETTWLDAPSFVIPHPIILEELDEFRGLASELGLTQGISQLFRETFGKPASVAPTATAISSFARGKFAELRHAQGVCKKHGFRVSGGSAICRVWRNGKVYEARFWIGSDDPGVESYTDDLVWVDGHERTMKIADVDPVAMSEGMRMASTIYAARAIEKEAS